jgi:Phage integrase family
MSTYRNWNLCSEDPRRISAGECLRLQSNVRFWPIADIPKPLRPPCVAGKCSICAGVMCHLRGAHCTFHSRRMDTNEPFAAKMAWKRLTKRARLENLRFHDQRHEAISRFFEKGLNVPEVALISGHRDLRMLPIHSSPRRGPRSFNPGQIRT